VANETCGVNVRSKAGQIDGLIYSMAEFWQPIERLLDSSRIRTVMEIGVEAGGLCQFLMEYCDRHRAAYIGVDPKVDPGVFEIISGRGHQLIQKSSLDALATAPAADAYFIDGDHNYYTVFNEMNFILERCKDLSPLIFLHDIGWPCSRRDLYYNPSAIPQNAIHPHTYAGGVVPGRQEICDWGFRVSDGAVASNEGGPKNGVLTAVEDALARHPGWDLIVIPGVFGLGIVSHIERSSLMQREALSALRQGLGYLSGLLTRLEENRVENYLAVIRIQRQFAAKNAVDLTRSRDGKIRRALWRLRGGVLSLNENSLANICRILTGYEIDADPITLARLRQDVAIEKGLTPRDLEAASRSTWREIWEEVLRRLTKSWAGAGLVEELVNAEARHKKR